MNYELTGIFPSGHTDKGSIEQGLGVCPHAERTAVFTSAVSIIFCFALSEKNPCDPGNYTDPSMAVIPSLVDIVDRPEDEEHPG